MFKSLRSRVIATAMITVAVASSTILMVIGLLIEPFAEQRQADQMQATIFEALEHDGSYPLEKLPAHLTKSGISVVIIQGENYFGSGDLAQAIIEDVNLGANTYVELQANLPQTGSRVIVAAIRTSAVEMWAPIFAIGVPTILTTLVIVMLTLLKTTRVALQPLDDMTTLATKIADGQTGGRLEVSDANSELGRTAVAFDKMLDSLEASLNRAKQAEERLRQLCADVAHELRSPLATIIARADNLMRNAGVKNQQKLAETTALSVVRDGQRAARIIGDLTLAAQLGVEELASRQMIFQRTDLVELLQDSVRAFEMHATVELRFNCKLRLNRKFHDVDPHRIQQILNNLLENANRHAKSYIEVSAERDDEAKQLLIQVFNDGPPISSKMREKIFDRFVRVDASRDQIISGSGLGLYISRSLAEAHGGSLVCLPCKTGARFELRLPLSQR